MYTLVLAIHLVLAIILIGLVLLQQGKGADVGAIMGSSGSNSLFGAGGASNFLVRLTTGVAIGFMFTSVMLIRLAASGAVPGRTVVDPLRGSAMEGVSPAAPAGTSAPAAAVTADAAVSPVSTVIVEVPPPPVAPVVVSPAAGK